MRADRSQRLVVQSREVVKKDAPFLEGVGYWEEPKPDPRLVDLRETWIGQGNAVYRGMVLFTRLAFVAIFFLFLARWVSVTPCQAVSALLCVR